MTNDEDKTLEPTSEFLNSSEQDPVAQAGANAAEKPQPKVSRMRRISNLVVGLAQYAVDKPFDFKSPGEFDANGKYLGRVNNDSADKSGDSQSR